MPTRTDVVATYDKWLTWVFDHPVARDEWYWDAGNWPNGNNGWPYDKHGYPGPDAPLALEYLTRQFDHPTPLVGRYSLGQLAQGPNLVGSQAWRPITLLFETTLPLADRRACIRAMESLSRKLFAVACNPELSHVRSSENPLNGMCYMWWDLLPYGVEFDPKTRETQTPSENIPLQKCMLDTMAAILKLDHPACQESALHGLGHFHEIYPARSAAIIRQFLAGKPKISKELLQYAQFAMEGAVQ